MFLDYKNDDGCQTHQPHGSPGARLIIKGCQNGDGEGSTRAAGRGTAHHFLTCVSLRERRDLTRWGVDG